MSRKSIIDEELLKSLIKTAIGPKVENRVVKLTTIQTSISTVNVFETNPIEISKYGMNSENSSVRQGKVKYFCELTSDGLPAKQSYICGVFIVHENQVKYVMIVSQNEPSSTESASDFLRSLIQLDLNNASAEPSPIAISVDDILRRKQSIQKKKVWESS